MEEEKSPLGIRVLQLGFILGDNQLAAPSQYALAQIGLMEYRELKGALEEIIMGIRECTIDIRDCPMMQYHFENGSLDMATMRYLARRTYGSQKIVSHQAIKVSDEGLAGVITSNQQATFKVRTRRLRRERRSNAKRKTSINTDNTVHIYRPTSIDGLRFEGGTDFPEWVLERSHHWSEGKEHEKKYLESLTDSQKAQFMRQIAIIDYARAAAQKFLHYSVVDGQNFIRGIDFLGGEEPVLPFTFRPKASNDLNEKYSAFKYALETFLLRASTPSDVRKATGHPTGYFTLAELDLNFFGKKGFVHPKTARAFKEGKIRKGAAIKGKSFKNYNWAIIQEIERYYFSKGKIFDGYSVEFMNHPELLSAGIIFESSEKERGFSMRIVLNDALERPYIMYKLLNPEREDLVGLDLFENVGPGGVSPLKLVNFPNQRRRKKAWLEPDWSTDSPVCLNMLFEPYDFILRRAAECSTNMPRGFVDYRTLKQDYMRLFQNRKK